MRSLTQNQMTEEAVEKMLKIEIPSEIKDRFDTFSLYVNYDAKNVFVCIDGDAQAENGTMFWVGAAQIKVTEDMVPHGEWEWVAGPYKP